MGKIVDFLIAISLLILLSQNSWGILLADNQSQEIYLAANKISNDERIQPFIEDSNLDPPQDPVYPLAKLMDNFDFTSDTIHTWWDVDGTKVYKREIDKTFGHSGTSSMEINYRKSSSRYKFSFFAFQPNQDGVDNDFSKYEELSFWIYTEKDMELIVKLEDQTKKKGSYEEKFKIKGKPEWQHIEFKFKDAEKIDLSKIDNVLFFVEPGRSKVKGRFWLDDLYLVKEEVPPTTPQIPKIEGIDLTAKGHLLKWEKVETASLYEVLISDNEEFKNPVSIFTNKNSLLIDDFAKGLTYFKIRAWSHLPEYQGKASEFSKVYTYQPEENPPPIIDVVWSQAGEDTDNNYPIGALVRIAVKEKYNAKDIIEAKARITSESTGYDSGWQNLHLSESKDYYFFHWNTLGLKPASDYRVEFVLKDKAGQIAKDDSLIITLTAYVPIVLSPTYELKNLISLRNFIFNLQYDPNYKEASVLGRYWRHTYQINLNIYADGLVEVIWPGLGSEFFQPIGGGKYKNLKPSIFLSELEKQGDKYVLKNKWAQKFAFDKEGKLLTIEERNGNQTKFIYDKKQLIEIIDPYGASLKLEYENGKLKKIKTPFGGEVKFYYSGNLLSKVIDLNGKSISFLYTSNEFLEEIVEEIEGKRKTTSFRYDSKARLIRKYEGYCQNDYSYRYIDEEATFIIYKAGRQFYKFIFNPAGQPIYIEDALGSVVRINYDERGLVKELIDKNGNKYQFEYDSKENIIQIIDPLGNKIHIDYHPEFNLPLLIEDPKGAKSYYEYDEKGNLIKVIDPLGNELKFIYDDRNLLEKLIDQNGNEINFEYDEYGNLIKIKDQLGYEIKFEFLNGLLNSFTDPLGNQFNLIYKPNSFLIGGFRDALGYLTRFEYNNSVNITSLVGPLGNKRTYTYDDLNRLIEVIYPDGSTTKYKYDKYSRIVSVIDREGNEIKFEYDELDRIKAKIYPDGSKIEFVYDGMGNLIYIKDSNGIYRYEYDALNRLIKEIYPDGSQISYEYDGAGNLIKIVYPDGSFVSYKYDLNNRLKEINDISGDYKFIYGDEFCQVGSCPNKLKLTKLIYPNGVSAIYGYDELGNLVLLEYKDKKGKVIKSYKYDYDANLNKIKLITEEGEYKFNYDALYQLIEANTPFGEYKFEYDGEGNRTALSKDEWREEYEVNELNQVIKAGDVEYRYDKNGNLVEKTTPEGITRYVYDYDNRLIKVIHPDASITEYKYDYLGRRIQKIHAGKVTKYIYAGWDLILELDEENNIVRRYVNLPEGGPISCQIDGQKIYYLRDRSNNIEGILDEGGKLIEEYKYSPFGKLINKISGINEVLYDSKIYDPETGFYYFLKRYYSPELGRFIQEDPEATLIDPNLYIFANNNPINFDDPYGTCLTWINARLGIGGHGGGGKFSLLGLLFFVGTAIAAPVLAPAVGAGIATGITAGTLLKAGVAAGGAALAGYYAYKGYGQWKELERLLKERKLIPTIENGHLKLEVEAQKTLGSRFKPPEGWKKWGYFLFQIFRLIKRFTDIFGGP